VRCRRKLSGYQRSKKNNFAVLSAKVLSYFDYIRREGVFMAHGYKIIEPSGRAKIILEDNKYEIRKCVEQA